MEQQFDGTEKTIQSPLISDSELRILFERINRTDEEQFEQAHQISPHDDWVTINAFCEVTGHHPEDVQRILEDIRRKDLHAKLATRLRELEEPTFRVERPGHSIQNSHEPLLRQQQINSMLDKLLPQKPLRQKLALTTTPGEKIVSTIGAIFAFLIVAGTIGIIVQAILTR